VRISEKCCGQDSANGREGTDKTLERRGNGAVSVKDTTEGDNTKRKER
jgi:hypothetical protein